MNYSQEEKKQQQYAAINDDLEQSTDRSSFPDYTSNPPMNMSPQPYYSQGPSIGASDQTALQMVYIKKRNKAKSCGKCVMYLGYFIMVCEILGLLWVVINLFTPSYKMPSGEFETEEDKRMDKLTRKIFGTSFKLTNAFFGFIGKGASLFQGYLMVKLTKVAIRQISSQEVNPSFRMDRQSPLVTPIERKILILIAVQIVIQAVALFYVFHHVDKFLQQEYKQEYLMMKEHQSYSSSFTGQMAYNKGAYQEELDEEKMKEIQGAFAMMTGVVGPITILITLLTSICCCSMVMCCIRGFKTNIELVEESPVNPANVSDTYNGRDANYMA